MWYIHSLPLELPLSYHLYQSQMWSIWLLLGAVAVAVDMALAVARVDTEKDQLTLLLRIMQLLLALVVSVRQPLTSLVVRVVRQALRGFNQPEAAGAAPLIPGVDHTAVVMVVRAVAAVPMGAPAPLAGQEIRHQLLHHKETMAPQALLAPEAAAAAVLALQPLHSQAAPE
jgi:hypothetical protein